MKWVTTEHQDILGAWAMEKINWGRCINKSWGPFTAIGLIDETQILAAVIYNDFYEVGCAIHIAAVPGKRWMTREYLHACFEYPFIQLGFDRLTGYVPATNMAARRLDEHFGFKQEGVLREMLPGGEDVIVYGMLSRECRYLRHGQTKSTRRTRSVSDGRRTDGIESSECSLHGGAQSHEHLRTDREPNLQQ